MSRWLVGAVSIGSMAAPYVDTFNRANVSALSASALSSDGRFSWSKSTFWTAELGITSNKVNVPSPVGGVDAEYNHDFGTADCQIDMVVGGIPTVSIDAPGICFRGDGGVHSWWCCVAHDATAQSITVGFFDTGGGFTPVGPSPVHTTVSVGDTLTVKCQGTSIQVLLNGVSKISVTNTKYQTQTFHGLHIEPNPPSNAAIDSFTLQPL